MYNRQQQLKEWKPMQPLVLPTEVIQYFEQKIQYECEKEGCLSLTPDRLISIEHNKPLIDINYLKYLALKHINNIIQYIQNKGYQLENIEENIRKIINEIITNQVSEDYYHNTIDIYESIIDKGIAGDVYDLIDEAIRLDNKRLLYYIIFNEDECFAVRAC